ncbi:MAG: FliA/WhiG family RNA polymerase sigma factor [Burkholderiaceae bacterium]|nr:FliA/WhiG family RNA polymerase sigma factor [Burkholderiaceae bacterium]
MSQARRNAYKQASTTELNEMVAKYAPLVRKLAFQVASRLPPNVVLDDLIQEGMMGLLDAIKRYEPRPGLNFEAYARFRITGAIYDSCRENDILPRNQRDKLSELEKALRRLEQELGRTPTEQEIAEACNLSIDEYHQTLDTMVGMTAIDDVPEHLLPIAEGADPSQITSFKQIANQLSSVIKDLPEKERMVVALHYQEDLSFREVAYVMDLTPGRISQIHTQAMVRIRAHLGNDPTFR